MLTYLENVVELVIVAQLNARMDWFASEVGVSGGILASSLEVDYAFQGGGHEYLERADLLGFESSWGNT
jgi:hypothetical protein